VITPTYNEADNITPLLTDLDTALAPLTYEIIVADDDSPDRTWEIAETYADDHPEVKVLRRFHDKGLSPAVLAAMEVARGDVFVVIDADRQHDEAIIPLMYDQIANQGADIAVGSRGAENGSYGEWSRFRRFVSWVAATIARLFLRVPVSDPMSGFFAISRPAYERLAGQINPRGFKIFLEFIGRGPDLKVVEVGYHFRMRTAGETKLNSSVIRNYLLAVFDLRFGHQVKPQFVLYTLVGLAGLAVNAVVYTIASWLGIGQITTGLGSGVDPVDGAALFGILAQVGCTFVANNWFTFWERRYRGPRVIVGALLFALISAYGLLIQFAVSKWLGGIGVHSAWIRHLIAILVAFQASYFLNVTLTWGRRATLE
jgi:dolichol-phosphate mannosyltransferase